MLLLINNLHEKSITEIKKEEILTARALQLCCLVITLHSSYMKNALLFNLWDARNFFMHIFK